MPNDDGICPDCGSEDQWGDECHGDCDTANSFYGVVEGTD